CLQAVRRRWYISPTTPSTLFAGPWVTSLSGTTNQNPEIAASISSGGFSTYFPRSSTRTTPCPPSSTIWSAAIKAFTSALAAVSRPDLFSNRNLCSAGSSGFPDIALQALGFEEFSRSSSTSGPMIKSLIASAKLIHKAPPSLIWQ
ncbi:hypothetical protein EDB89DRAFT_623076, partial [Lactarius sanguifluus]